MGRRREFVIECEDIGNGVWTPDWLGAREGVDEEVVRCRDCVWYAPLRCMCRRADFTVLDGDGYCAWGERRGQTP